MPDQFTEISRQGFFSRIINSFLGIIIGLIMFFGSFVLLYWNEGRVDLSKIAETATHINSEKIDESASGKLVSTTGSLTSEQKLGDNLYLKPGDFISVSRKAEMYAWEEDEKTETHKDIGGSETTETTYIYETKWTENPASSSNFKDPTGHQNPEMQFNSETVNVDSAKIGIYDLEMSGLMLSGYSSLQLNNQNINLPQGAKLENNYIYMGIGSVQNPQVGDIQISYKIIKSGINATIFGKLENKTISAYYDQDKNKLFRMYTGSREEAISSMQLEHTVMTWIFRALGLILMWAGLSAIFRPISVFLDIMPILGDISRAIIGLITFIISLGLTIVTIGVSMIVHNIIALIIVLAVVIAIIIALLVILFKMKKKKIKSIK